MSGIASLSSQAALITATLDLSLVQSLVGAIRTADLTSAAEAGPVRREISTERTDFYCCCPSQPLIEPRPHLHPAAVYEPAPVIHSHPRLALDAATYGNPLPPPHRTPSPIQPPWKVLPWENPSQPCQTIKVHKYHTDVIPSGMLLDLFV